jgi:hypothetical protein
MPTMPALKLFPAPSARAVARVSKDGSAPQSGSHQLDAGSQRRAPPSSMRVPKASRELESDASGDWFELARQANAKLETEEREWNERIVQVRAALARAQEEQLALVREEQEWHALRERARLAQLQEEREWSARIGRVRASARPLPYDAPYVVPRAVQPPRVHFWP